MEWRIDALTSGKLEMRLAVIGAGYVGLVSGACFTDLGHTVVCVDKDETEVAALKRGEIRSTSPASTISSLATPAPAGSPSPPISPRSSSTISAREAACDFAMSRDAHFAAALRQPES